MLFMSVCNYDPEIADQVAEKGAEWRAMMPEGCKLIAEWTDLQSHRNIVLFEAETSKDLLLGSLVFANMGGLATFTMMATEEVVKALSSE